MTIEVVNTAPRLIESTGGEESLKPESPRKIVKHEAELSPLMETHKVIVLPSCTGKISELNALIKMLAESPACDEIKTQIQQIHSEIHSENFPKVFSSAKHTLRALNKLKSSLMDQLVLLEQEELTQLLLSTNAHFDFQFIELAKLLKLLNEGMPIQNGDLFFDRLINIGLYRKALSIVEDYPAFQDTVYLLIANYYATQGRVNTALKYVGKLSLRIPKIDRIYCDLALKIGLAGFVEEAFIMTQKIKVGRYKKRVVTYVTINLLDNGRTDKAYLFLTKTGYIVKDIKPAKLFFERLVKDRYFEELDTIVEELSTGHESLPLVYRYVAEVYALRGKYDLAEKAIDENIQSPVLKYEAQLAYAKILLKRRRTKKALEVLKPLHPVKLRDSKLLESTYLLAVKALIRRQKYKTTLKFIKRIPRGRGRDEVIFQAATYTPKVKSRQSRNLLFDEIKKRPQLFEDSYTYFNLLVLNGCFDEAKKVACDQKISDFQRLILSVYLAKQKYYEVAKKVALLIDVDPQKYKALATIFACRVIDGADVETVITMINDDVEEKHIDYVLNCIVNFLLIKNCVKESSAFIAEMSEESIKKEALLYLVYNQSSDLCDEGKYDESLAMIKKTSFDQASKDKLLLEVADYLLRGDLFSESIQFLREVDDQSKKETFIAANISSFTQILIEEGRLNVLHELFTQISSLNLRNDAIDEIEHILTSDENSIFLETTHIILAWMLGVIPKNSSFGS